MALIGIMAWTTDSPSLPINDVLSFRATSTTHRLRQVGRLYRLHLDEHFFTTALSRRVDSHSLATVEVHFQYAFASA